MIRRAVVLVAAVTAIATLSALVGEHPDPRHSVHVLTVRGPGDAPDALAAVGAAADVAAWQSGIARAEAERWAVIEARWVTVGRCEQPDPSGWQGVAWGTVSSVYSGGLGFANSTWAAWGGLDFAPNAGLATPHEQMIVAERVLASVGRGAWGCPVP